MGERETGHSAVEFEGSWREFLPIAFTNFLLTVVTLGIYRFWAKARERRYLWSRTRVIGDPIEWTGTGKEMFIGFVIVAAILIPLYLGFQFLVPALAARGMGLASTLTFMALWMTGAYLGAVGLFRALRYRLARTYWRGIRGGSNAPGWGYGLKALGYTGYAFLTAGLVYPWSKARLFNLRWGAMGFGDLTFESDMESAPLYGRWLALYALIPGSFIFFGMFIAFLSATAAAGGFLALGILFLLAVYVLGPLIFLSFWAKFYREAADNLTLGELRFAFKAKTWDWVKLYVGNLLLAIVTFGFGIMFWTYRTWSFVARHIEIYGLIDTYQLEQSTAHAPGDSEGLADAFDIGAF